MKIQTNSKVNFNSQAPSTYKKLVVNENVNFGLYTTFRATLKGERKDTLAIVTIYSSDNTSRSILLQSDGKFYINGTLQSLEYNYITPTYFDTNGNMEGFGDLI